MIIESTFIRYGYGKGGIVVTAETRNAENEYTASAYWIICKWWDTMKRHHPKFSTKNKNGGKNPWQ